MPDYRRRQESGRYDHERGVPKKPKDPLTKLKEWLVPGSGEGPKYPQNKQESDELKKRDREDS